MNLVSFSYLGCAIAFLGLAPLLPLRREDAAATTLMPLAMALTGLWAAVSAAQVIAESAGWSVIVELTLAAAAFEVTRNAAWLILLGTLMHAGEPGRAVSRACE